MELDYGAWTARWEAQQAGYTIDREERFAILFDALEAIVGAGPMTVLDVGCGPGSLAVRLLDRFPSATVIGVDVDPVLLALGRGAHGGMPGLRFADADLRDPGWSASLGLDGPVDAAVSTTALHWLSLDDLARLYRDLAGLVRPGGAFLDADHDQLPEGAPRLVEAARAMLALARRRAAPSAAPETWDDWWRAVAAEPGLASALEARERLAHAHPQHRHRLDEDCCRLLRAAGFAEAAVLWRHGHDRLLAAVR